MDLLGNIKIFGVTGIMSSGKTHTLKMFQQIAIENNLKFKYIEVDTIRRNIVKKINLPTQNNIFSNTKEMAIYRQKTNHKIKEALIKQVESFSGIIAIEWAMLAQDDLIDLVKGQILIVNCNRHARDQRLKNADLSNDQLNQRIIFQNKNLGLKTIVQWQKKQKQGWTISTDTSNNPSLDFYRDLFDQILNKL